ncbi:hypothetical protein [Aestuariivirga sp.]|uniref:hypothetical protein n=1 Tax=Aestuariivirga sp. TaxID=2650926 RepID=UPI0039E545FF
MRPRVFSAFASPRKAKSQSGVLPGSDSMASAKPGKLGKPDDTVSANNWVSSKPNAPVKKLAKKPVTTAKAGTASKDKLAAKKTLKKATEVASASPDTAKKAATVKPVSKPAAATAKAPATADKCKPGADGKLSSGCKSATATPAKPKVKPTAETAAN